MKKLCEMQLSNYFKLSNGQIALVGNVEPYFDKFITRCKADLYIGNHKLRSINIIGEDRFSGGSKSVRQDKRSVRTNDNIYDDLKSVKPQMIKLIFYSET